MFAHAALAATLALLSAPSALAHVGMFHPSLYGFNASGREPEHWYDQDVNNDFTRNPLRLMDNLKFDEWWFHGLRGAKPNAVMQLPAGGKVNIEMSCNKAFTSYTTRQDQLDLVGDMPCMINQDANGRPHYGDPNVPASNGPLHVADKSDAKGCALAIAYTNDVYSITPKTFTVFSVNHTCVWTRNTQFEIPADMPPCPNGKCICSWNWIHGGDRGQGLANELYMNGFDCNIVNAKKDAPKLATPKTAKLCKDEPEKCIKGAKQGLYWQGAVADGWNVPLNESTRDPPFYNEEWGFKDGAQNDIFDRSQEVARVSHVKQNAVVQDKKTSTKDTKAPASTATPKATPTASPTKVAEAIQAPAEVANTKIAVGFARQAIVTQTVVVTRTHLVVVTEEASPLSSKRSIKRSKRHDKRRLEARHGLGFSS